MKKVAYLLVCIVVMLTTMTPARSTYAEDNTDKEPVTAAPEAKAEGSVTYVDATTEQPNVMAASCTIVVDDPIFQSNTTIGRAIQTCVGAAYQELTVCMDVEWWWGWVQLGCDGNSTIGNQLVEYAGPYNYAPGTHRYRLRAQGRMQAVMGGPVTTSPWIASLNWPTHTY